MFFVTAVDEGSDLGAQGEGRRAYCHWDGPRIVTGPRGFAPAGHGRCAGVMSDSAAEPSSSTAPARASGSVQSAVARRRVRAVVRRCPRAGDVSAHARSRGVTDDMCMLCPRNLNPAQAAVVTGGGRPDCCAGKGARAAKVGHRRGAAQGP